MKKTGAYVVLPVLPFIFFQAPATAAAHISNRDSRFSFLPVKGRIAQKKILPVGRRIVRHDYADCPPQSSQNQFPILELIAVCDRWSINPGRSK